MEEIEARSTPAKPYRKIGVKKAKIVSNAALTRLSQSHRQNYNNVMGGGDEKEGEGM